MQRTYKMNKEKACAVCAEKFISLKNAKYCIECREEVRAQRSNELKRRNYLSRKVQ